MNDIELVIKIPKKTYEQLKFLNEQGFGTVIDELVVNGTPLPKGHGRLIDAEELCKGLMKRWNTANERLETLISEVMSDVVTPIIVSTPTIIEADKGE